jgi:hypothetical protein
MPCGNNSLISSHSIFLDFIQSLPLVPSPLELALTDYPTGGSCYHGLWRGETAKFNTVDDLALLIRDDVQQFQREIRRYWTNSHHNTLRVFSVVSYYIV